MVNRDTTVDVRHVGRVAFVSSRVLITDAGPALIDTGPGSTLPTLKAGLAALGIGVQDLHTILLSHIHLDHAGAAGLLLEENPRIVVYVHELGARHMIDPTKLVASASRIFGENMDRLWGRFLPVPASQVRVIKGGETIDVANRRFEVIYTPGHAVHHVAYHEPADRTVYAGDVGGIRLPSLPVPLPVSPLPDFNLEDWLQSLDKITAVKPRRLFRTHFGFSDDVTTELAELRANLIDWAQSARMLLDQDLSEETRADRFDETIRAWLDGKAPPDVIKSYADFSDFRASYNGIASYWRKKS